MIWQGKVVASGSGVLFIRLPDDAINEISDKNVSLVAVQIDDGRTISGEQRKFAYATLHEIAEWSGDTLESTKEYFKSLYCRDNCRDGFSLSDCDMTTAAGFIDMLVEFCVRWGVPVAESLARRASDHGKYVYACVMARKCAVCGADAEIHHYDRVGMGSDRTAISHEGLRAMPLCAEHHRRVHTEGGEDEFYDKNYIVPVKLDKRLIRILREAGLQIS